MLPKQLSRKTIYESQYIRLHLDKVKMPSGEIIEAYHVLDYPKDFSVILLTRADGKILMIKSKRYITQTLEWELAAGDIEAGESIEEGARRELMEETGYKAKEIRKVYSFNPSNGISNEAAHFLMATLDEDFEQKEFDQDEVKEVVWLSENEIRELIKNNEIKDGASLLPLAMYFAGLVKI